ncbi:MAG: crossover junction endodeoxyribonuclease RuvC [Chloroflexi bacterium]|nr:crossover junction endodeoxyribonuclease RuvC [Chloroflexota bacterium]
MIVIGIDPGIGLTGYGVVREDANGDPQMIAYGAISTKPKTPLPDRLQQLYVELTGLIEEHQPTTAAVERLLFGKNVTTALAVGQARGVILLALAHAGLPIGEYEPASIKQAVAGYGNAPKAQVQDMVRMLLDLDDIPKPDDAADALAVAITHLHSTRYQQLLDE